MPFRDDSGQLIADMVSWNRSRNQQRNWETVNQIISLRCLPENITSPLHDLGSWHFDFEIPALEPIQQDLDPMGWLYHDCRDVPMILGLGEASGLAPVLMPQHIIWFNLAQHK